MREEDDKIAALRRALNAGDDQLDQGKGIPYTRDILTQATEKARDNAKRGKKVKSDVRRCTRSPFVTPANAGAQG